MNVNQNVISLDRPLPLYAFLVTSGALVGG